MLAYFVLGCVAILLKNLGSCVENPVAAGTLQDLTYMSAAPLFMCMVIHYRSAEALAHVYCKFADDDKRNDIDHRNDKTTNYNNLRRRAIEHATSYWPAVEGRLR